MIATGAEVLARLRLVQGRSSTDLREFVRSNGQTLLMTVGADVDCDWCVREAGVAAIHFSLHWDGSTLRIADTHGAGTVRVDGKLLGTEWRRLGGRARIDFGRAALVVEAATWSSYPEPSSNPSINRGALPGLASKNDSSRPAASSPPRNAGSTRPAAEHANGSFPAGTQRNAGHVGGTTVAYVDERTVQGYPPVHVANNVRVGVTESGASQSQRPAAVVSVDDSRAWIDARVDAQVTHGAPATSLVLHRDGGAPANLRRFEGGGLGSQEARIPKAVLVLSPLTAAALPAPPRSVPRDAPPKAPQPLPGWNTVIVGLVSLLGGYAGWLYLLHRL